MFVLRPDAKWQSSGIKPFKAAPDQRGPFSLFSSLSPRRSTKAHRRAIDALGLRAPVGHRARHPFFVSSPEARAGQGRLVVDYTGDEWMSPEENQQMLELQDSADGMMNELTYADQTLASLSAGVAQSQNTTDLSQTAQQTFSRIDSLMERWSLRAEQIEQANSGTQWVAFNPVNGSRFSEMVAQRRPGTRQLLPARAQMANSQPHGAAFMKGAEKRGIAPTRSLQTAGQIKQRRIRLAEKSLHTNNDKVGLLRQQMNQLAAKPAGLRNGGMRRIGMAKLASLHESIDHRAHELHEHRDKIKNNIHKSVGPSHSAKAALTPAPVYKPKTKGETTS